MDKLSTCPVVDGLIDGDDCGHLTCDPFFQPLYSGNLRAMQFPIQFAFAVYLSNTQRLGLFESKRQVAAPIREK